MIIELDNIFTIYLAKKSIYENELFLICCSTPCLKSHPTETQTIQNDCEELLLNKTLSLYLTLQI